MGRAGGSDGGAVNGNIGAPGAFGDPGSPGTAGSPGSPGDAGEASEAGTGGNIAVGIATLTVDGTVVALAVSGGDCSGVDAVSESYNADSDDSCNFDDPTDLPGMDAAALALGALADNGGPTQTQRPDPSSVLVNDIPDADCFVDVDQRGVTRPQGGGCEIGAVELAVEVTVAVDKTASDSQVSAGDTVDFEISVENNSTGSSETGGVDVVDPLCDDAPVYTGGDTDGNDRLDPGETWTYACAWLTDVADVGVVTNVATVTVTDQLGNVSEHEARVDVEVLGDDPTDPAAAAAAAAAAAGTASPVAGASQLLPVTGASLALLTAVALCALAGGYVLVRAARRRSTA
jgi:uncharacterized repeat protein (TIGR01451 family)